MVLQEALALSSMNTMGNSGQVRAAIDRGLALAEAFQDQQYQLRFHASLSNFLRRIADFRGALAVAEQGHAIAHTGRDPTGLLISEWMLGMSHHLVGNQAAAQLHCEVGMTYAARYGMLNAHFFGHDQYIRALVTLARALWLRGFADQAFLIAQRAIDEAKNWDRPISVCVSLIYSSSVFLWTGDYRKAEDLVERLITYAGRHSFSPYRAVGIALKGELAVIRGEAEAGLELIRTALNSLRAEQHRILITTFMGALADGLRKTEQFEEALLTINGAICRATACGVTFDMAELLRIKARILAAMPQPHRSSTIDCLTHALAVAREQSALALELRTATALAHALSESGRRDRARQMLAAVYHRFTEGFETADLRIACQLIESLT
jgi:hypothetical protein